MVNGSQEAGTEAPSCLSCQLIKKWSGSVSTRSVISGREAGRPSEMRGCNDELQPFLLNYFLSHTNIHSYKLYVGVLMLRLCYLLLLCLVLSGCSSMSDKIGVSQQQWQMMPKQTQQHYEKMFKELALVHVDYPGIVTKNAIEVNIVGGTAMFPHFKYASSYQPIYFSLFSGQCKYVTIFSSHTVVQKTQLYACYDHKTLALDPSRFNKMTINGSLIFTYNPAWQDGFQYNKLDSHGYVRFHDSYFTLHVVPKSQLHKRV